MLAKGVDDTVNDVLTQLAGATSEEALTVLCRCIGFFTSAAEKQDHIPPKVIIREVSNVISHCHNRYRKAWTLAEGPPSGPQDQG
jgi:hypothetical protein